MSDPKHIAVIGSGIVGLTTAWKFASQGVRVSVFGLKNAPDMASWAAVGHVGLKGGVVRPGEEYLSKPGYVLKAKGVEAFEAWIKDIEVSSGHRIELSRGFHEFYSNADQRETIFKRVLENRIKHQSSWGNTAELSSKNENEASGSFVYSSDLYVNPNHLLPALAQSIESLGGKLVETLVKTFELGENNKMKLLCSNSELLGVFDGLVVASSLFAKPFLDTWNLTKVKPRETLGWKASVSRTKDLPTLFSGKDFLAPIFPRGIPGVDPDGSASTLEIRKTRPIVWQPGSVETSFSNDPGIASARRGVRFESKDQSPLIGQLTQLGKGGENGFGQPFFGLNICHHKSGFVTALPAASILWKDFSGQQLSSWEKALSPLRFAP